MNTAGYKFQTIKSANDFLNSSSTDKATFFHDQIKNDVKIVGKEQDVYYYDEEQKLWICTHKHSFKSYVFDWFNETAKSLEQIYLADDKKSDIELAKKMVEAGDDTDDDDDDDDVYRKQIQKSKQKVKAEQKIRKDRNEALRLRKIRSDEIKKMDFDSFVETIIKRSIGKLHDDVFVKKLDSNPHSFPIQNGKKVDYKTMIVSERVKEDYFTFESPVDLLTSNLPHATKFFTQLMPNLEEREYLRRVLGYMISGDVSARCFFVLYGDGSNGKSTIMNLMKLILMKYYHQCDKALFIKSNKTGATPEKAALLGTRLAVYNEGETADDMHLDFSTLKEISGDDTINARALFKSPINFKAQCKLTMLTNFVPPITAEKAIKKRLRYVFFDQNFEACKDGKGFIESLETDYLSEIFTWIMQGTKNYYSDLKVDMPQSFQERTDELLKLEDSIESFITSKVERTTDKKDYIKRGTLFDTYRDFCTENSQRCQPRSTLFNRMQHLKYPLFKKDGYDIYRYINIKLDEVDEPEKDDAPNPLDAGIEELIAPKVEAEVDDANDDFVLDLFD